MVKCELHGTVYLATLYLSNSQASVSLRLPSRPKNYICRPALPLSFKPSDLSWDTCMLHFKISFQFCFDSSLQRQLRWRNQKGHLH